MIEGSFIVIEGIDGSGTTTHSERLAEALRKRGLPVHVTHEPSEGPIGVLIRQVLTGRVVVDSRPLRWDTMATLFAADRLDHLQAEILPNIRDGVTVISDRYDHSSIAYQSTAGGGGDDTLAWVKALNRRARRPDLTIVLDVPADVAHERRASRSGGPELYEHREFQDKLIGFYVEIDQHFPNDKIVHVSADGPIESVAAKILEHVLAFRGD